MGFYIESYDRPPESAIVAEDIRTGEGLVVNTNGKAEQFDGSTHTLGDFVGVADNPFTGDQIREHEEDDEDFEVYDVADDDRVTYGGDADRDRIRIRTAGDTGGNEPTPDVSHKDVVGFIDTSAGTLSSTAEYEGRIVGEGYSDGDATTYSRANDNFVALGVVYRDEANAYDDAVRVEVRTEL